MDINRMTVEQINGFLNNSNPTEQQLEILSRDNRAGVKRSLERHFAAREAKRCELDRLQAMLKYETSLRQQGYTYIAGVDEAGRGPLAGPVVAAAVILPEGLVIPGLNDSKKLLPAKRESLYRVITAQAIAWSVGIGEVFEIDTVNILEASKLAMRRSIDGLLVKPQYVLIDALELDHMECPQKGIIGGDGLSQSIAAASVVAKVTRDRWMCEMDKVYPGYGFALHKGYPTNEHRRALTAMGACPMHRRSFTLLPEDK